jgi:hypothetical protein
MDVPRKRKGSVDLYGAADAFSVKLNESLF